MLFAWKKQFLSLHLNAGEACTFMWRIKLELLEKILSQMSRLYYKTVNFMTFYSLLFFF